VAIVIKTLCGNVLRDKYALGVGFIVRGLSYANGEELQAGKFEVYAKENE